MTGWNNVKLGEICSITSSKRIFAKEYQTEGIPFYRGKEIIEKHNGNEVSTELFITRERYEEIKSKFDVPHKGDILLSSVGTLGVSWLVDEEEFYFKDGNLTWLRCNEQTTPEFLYLWLNSPEAQNQIDAMCIGSTQKALTIETLNKFNVALPTLDIQNKICQIINPISQKITVNRATNRNLSEQLKAIFDAWFNQMEPFGGKEPEGTQYVSIEKLCSAVTKGTTPTTLGMPFTDEGVNFIKGETILDNHG
ncbi:MAG: restriction endonuclease subunit S, partial [Clostridiales bacterium]|nr:restriction endonuclease subunit S [Clostridiales bacterium]